MQDGAENIDTNNIAISTVVNVNVCSGSLFVAGLNCQYRKKYRQVLGNGISYTDKLLDCSIIRS